MVCTPFTVHGPELVSEGPSSLVFMAAGPLLVLLETYSVPPQIPGSILEEAQKVSRVNNSVVD